MGFNSGFKGLMNVHRAITNALIYQFFLSETDTNGSSLFTYSFSSL